MKGRGLTPAHQGYRYQDIFTAYFFMRCLNERYKSISVDKKRFDGDIFDDLHIQQGSLTTHYQVKSSRNEMKQFHHSQLLRKSSDIRINLLFDSFLQSDNNKDIYILCATWLPPEDSKYLYKSPTSKSVSNSQSISFKLDSDTIWPINSVPVWEPLHNEKYDRIKFIEFCEAFTIELALPISSETLNEPSILEQELINLVKHKVGVGSYPNQDRDPIDFSALAISLANLARTQNATHTPTSIEVELGLRTDFGKLNQSFPINFDIFVNRDSFENSLISNAKKLNHQVVLGSPGAGKSWTLTRLSEKLEELGVCVAKHYCYLEPGDEELERRVSTECLFANLLYELTNKNNKLRDNLTSRYSTTMESLNEAIKVASEQEELVVLMVDGLDHISRVLSEAEELSFADTDIIGQICSLALPNNVVLILGSQPGEHIKRITESLGERVYLNSVPSWDRFEIEALMNSLSIPHYCDRMSGVTFKTLIDAVLVKSDGNPLYATFLAKELLNRNDINTDQDLGDWFGLQPNLNGNVTSYYQYLLSKKDDGTLLIAHILGLIDFGITIEELKQVSPLLAPIVNSSIKHLSPILTDVTGQGGLRIYHESFRRFVVESQPNSVHIRHILQPITEWLFTIGFFQSTKSYRFLLVLLRRQKEAHKVLELVSTEFISKSLEFGHPEIAIEKNLEIAIEVASQLNNWAALTRFAELKRSLHTCFEEKLHDQLNYWETFTKVFGAELTAERLLFDGQPTLPTRLGLAVCALIGDAGYVAPWREYLFKESSEKPANTSVQSGSNYDYDENFQHSINRFKGLLATKGRLVGYKRLAKFLIKQQKALREDYIYELLTALQAYFDSNITLRISNFASRNANINSSSILGTAHLCKAERETGEKRSSEADLAISYLKSRDKIKLCLMLNANPENCKTISKKTSDIDLSIGSHSPEYENIVDWFLSLHINTHCYEDELKRIREGGNWYSQWLEFLIRLAEHRTSNNSLTITEIFKIISENTAPFKGEPRSCDLYHVQPLIIQSIIDGLQLTSTEQEFKECIRYVKIAMDETGTSMDRGESGPIQTIPLLTQLCAISHLNFAQNEILEFCMAVVKDSESYGTYFESHAEIGMSLAYLLSSFGLHEESKQEWRKITQYLCAYGWRKDVTINEILDSLPSIARSNWSNGKEAFLKSLPLAQALRRHTDGRETKHAINHWFSSLCRSNLNIALEVLSGTLHDYDGGVSWVLDTATHSVLGEFFKKSLDPIGYHVLCTTEFNFRYEGDAKNRISEELKIIEKFFSCNKHLGTKYFENLVKRYLYSSCKYPEEVLPQLEEFAETHSLNFNQRVSIKPKEKISEYIKSDEISDCIRQKITPKIRLPLRNSISNNKETELRKVINFVTERMDLRARVSLESFINYFGYALCEYSETNGEQQAGEFLLLFAEKTKSTHLFENDTISYLGDGFSRLNKHDLACIAYTLSYVFRRGSGGWGNIGDELSEHYLLKAVEINKELALNIFSRGVGHLISVSSYNYKITNGIICRLSSIGLYDEANQAWWSAYEVIKHRLPLTEEDDYCWLDSSSVVTPRGWTSKEGIISVLLAKLDSPYIEIKHQVLLALKHLIESAEPNLVKPLNWFLTESAFVTSTEVLLALLIKYDDTNFISRKIKCTLELLADSPLWIIKNSSRSILKQLNDYKHQDYTIDIAKESLEQSFVSDLLSMDKSNKTFFLSTIWYDFAQTYADTLSFRLTKSEFNKEQWKARLRLQHGERGDCYPGVQVLGWDEELAEITTNEVLNNLEIEQQEIPDSSEASDLAVSLLPDVEAYIAFHELRCARENYPLPIEIIDTSKRNELDYVMSDGPYRGWIRAAYTEQQWLFDENSYSKEAIKRIVVQSALAIEPNDFPAPEGVSPMFKDEDIRWESHPIEGISLPMGLCFGLADYSSFLGEIQVITPHPDLITALNLSLSSLFTLKDKNGEEVLIFRNWQKIHEKSYDTDVIELKGSEILMHPTLIERVNNVVGTNIVVLTKSYSASVSNPLKRK
ncbi:hypothetical protein [Enterovibrio norvegicus]|uniref:hypothetical protein n=1 Tax=Enterovibrio norvegicus TaxID=188144 RepID=UPI000C86619A|nr:hypothetical protein [Enterovibrio norvegicus]PML76552.1 hypothetical protein BCT69_23045 [Enterovibrio norvegicus]